MVLILVSIVVCFQRGQLNYKLESYSRKARLLQTNVVAANGIIHVVGGILDRPPDIATKVGTVAGIVRGVCFLERSRVRKVQKLFVQSRKACMCYIWALRNHAAFLPMIYLCK